MGSRENAIFACYEEMDCFFGTMISCGFDAKIVKCVGGLGFTKSIPMFDLIVIHCDNKQIPPTLNPMVAHF